MGDSRSRGTRTTLIPVMTPERISELLMPTVWSMRAEIGESLILTVCDGYCCDRGRVRKRGLKKNRG